MLESRPIPQQMLDKAAVRQKKVAEKGINRKSRKVERVAQIDPVLFHNGIQQGRRLGVKKHNPWDDPAFSSEMSKEHPEIGDMGGGGGCTITQSTLDWARKRVGG